MWITDPLNTDRFLVTVEDAADFLSISDGQLAEKGDLLASFIAAVTDLLEGLAGPLVACARAWTGECTWGFVDLGAVRPLQVWTPTAITNVTTGAVIPVASVRQRAGMLEAVSGALASDGDQISIACTAGMWPTRTDVPARIIQAAREALIVCWQTQNTRELPPFALSWRGAEWLGAHKLPGIA